MKEDPERLFLFKLAIDLHKTVGELERMDSMELTEWLVYYSLEPERHEQAKKLESKNAFKNMAMQSNQALKNKEKKHGK